MAASLLPASAAPGGRFRSKVLIDLQGPEWESQQVQEACVLPNPKDPTRLIIFYSGVPKSNRATCFIGKAWAPVADPLDWHEDAANPIFRPGATGWDSGSIRLDCVLYVAEEDAYYIYYSGTTGMVQDRIGLAVCPAGPDGYSSITPVNIVRQGDRPVLAPEPAAPFHEEMASQSAVLREWNAATRQWDWTMYYSYRGKDGILPGLRLATSTDGRNWTRHFNPADPRGMGQIFPSVPGAYYEWHQIFKVGGLYLLSMEVGINKGERWRPVIAVSERPRDGWRQLDADLLLQAKWGSVYRDDAMYHVATPAFYEIGGRWYLFVQACALPTNHNYIDGAWKMWGFTCDRRLPVLPGGLPLPAPGE